MGFQGVGQLETYNWWINVKLNLHSSFFSEREKSQRRERTGRRKERNGAKGEREGAARERGKGGKKMG